MSPKSKDPKRPTEAQSKIIGELNDATRTRDHPNSKMVFTPGLIEHFILKTGNIILMAWELGNIKDLIAECPIEPGNDPYGERDFGAFDYVDIRCLWKIDYYDIDDQNYGSAEPWDASKTMRVLTVMLTNDY